MADLSSFHVKTIIFGEPDFTANDKLSRVIWDQKTYYYDFTGMGVTADEFKDFICGAWDIDPDQVDVGLWDKNAGSLRADIE